MAFSYDLSVFSTLRMTYPTWEAFQAYMESDTGGSFRIMEQHPSGICLLRYEKGVSSMALPHASWCRSILWDKNTHLPLSIAPPKACEEAIPYATLGEAIEKEAVCQEMLDGWMIHVFRRADDPTLYLASRSHLHATGNFYSSRSFRELFLEAYMGTTGPFAEETLQADPFFQGPCVEKKQTAVFYSFLVQHKEHRVVRPIKTNRAVLIQKGVVYETGHVTLTDNPLSTIPTIVHSAHTDETHTPFSLWNSTYLSRLSWEDQGIVWKDRTGRRWRYRSSAYDLVRSLRGNHACSVDRYAQLYTQNLTHTYLQYFFEDSVPFSFYRVLLQRITKELFQAYLDVHVYRNLTRDRVLSMYHPHLYQLHYIYRTQLRPIHAKMNVVTLQKYLYSLPWQRISFLLRQHPLWDQRA